MRKAFTTVAIGHQASLLPKAKFNLSASVNEFSYLNEELDNLEERGVIIEDSYLETGYRVASEILLTWLADELVKVVRPDLSFQDWLRNNCIEEALISEKEKKAFKKAVIGLSGGFDSAIVTYIAVEALGKENVHVVLMPSKYSSEGSITDSLFTDVHRNCAWI